MYSCIYTKRQNDKHQKNLDVKKKLPETTVVQQSINWNMYIYIKPCSCPIFQVKQVREKCEKKLAIASGTAIIRKKKKKKLS